MGRHTHLLRAVDKLAAAAARAAAAGSMGVSADSGEECGEGARWLRQVFERSGPAAPGLARLTEDDAAAAAEKVEGWVALGGRVKAVGELALGVVRGWGLEEREVGLLGVWERE